MGIDGQNLLDVKMTLDNWEVPFWLAFGTFLGAYRDGDLISWDKDADLVLCAEDALPFLHCVHDLSLLGFEVKFTKDVIVLTRDKEKVDLCLFMPVGDKKVWHQIQYDTKDFGDNTVELLGATWRILSNPEKWLSYTYGDDWKIPIKGKTVGEGYPLGS